MNFFYEGGKGKRYSVLSRFDADLSLDVNEPELKQSWMGLNSHFYFTRGLNKEQKQRAIQRAIKQ
ncbi:hypothetical protein RS130_20315 [Paraglaciecola aquimarina]|uniref:Uncharacterized protein n=1 Tax=Paraglaciecola aquimarina TaxID=1235557 RepID=A0ABU3T161_9ALTE|nr:hypothetical protein [Paraglaciecola aquimarina]MDU0355917.1 hypothetical protein [Paraglaciecola aquimarina]